MLYNVYINNNIVVKVTEHNSHCTPCNKIDSIPAQEVRVMKVDLPIGWKLNNIESKFDQIKKYINLNNLL